MAQLEYFEQKGEDGLPFVCAEAMAALPDCCKGLRERLATNGSFEDVTRTLDDTDAGGQQEMATNEVVQEVPETTVTAVETEGPTSGLPETETTVGGLYSFWCDKTSFVCEIVQGWKLILCWRLWVCSRRREQSYEIRHMGNLQLKMMQVSFHTSRRRVLA